MTQSSSAQQRLMLYENEQLSRFVTQFYALMNEYGYQHVQVPAIEQSDLFLNRAGDQIIANLFTFDRFGKQLALRPEFTALAAHRYAKSFPNGKKTVRWYFNGSIFLEDYKQRGTNYQRMSIGAELFGLQSHSYADAEILYMAASGIFSVASLSDTHIAVGHIGLIREILSQYQLDERTEHYILEQMIALAQKRLTPTEVIEQFEEDMTFGRTSSDNQLINTPVSLEQGTHHMLDAMLDANERGTTMGGRNRKDIVQRLMKKHQRITLRDQVADAVHHLYEWISIEGNLDSMPRLRALLPKSAVAQFDGWTNTLDMICQMGVEANNLRIVPGLVRNWNYYTDIVFEFRNDDQVYFGGGGRYDELVRLMGADTNVPAIGFAYDVDAILAHMENEQMAPYEMPLLFAFSASNMERALPWLQILRQAGISVNVVNQAECPADALHLTDTGDMRYQNRVFSKDTPMDLTKAIQNV